jgi:hypothetical protein
VKGGNVLVSPYLKDRGPFIAGRQLDNYKLFIYVSTKGFTIPVGPNMRRSVHRGQLEVSTVFGPILEFSRLPPTIPWALHGNGVDSAQVGSWGGCIARSLLHGDVFPRGAMRWTV